MGIHHHEHHNDGNSHSHTVHHSTEGRNLVFAFFLNLCITIVEVIGGLLSNSLALLSDAVHNLSDTFAVMLAYIANRISQKDATEKKTFGYKRIEILAALLNAVILIVITIFLFIEAYHRFFTPGTIKGRLMLIVAVIGLIANLGAVFILKKNSHSNINIRAAYLHLLGDTISSVAVIAGAILITYFKLYWVDPLVTVVIGLYILKEAYAIMKEALDILMQSTPTSVEISDVVEAIEKYNEVDNVHHVHSWKLDDKQIHFECHLDLNKDMLISESDLLRLEIERLLKNKFGISHVTIQYEYNCCSEKNIIHTHKKQH
jgi:cobalt-zinc-cadmium efflux system protein